MKEIDQNNKEILQNIDPAKIPVHVAIIMDGNGRWARARGISRVEGHRKGVESVREVVEVAAEMGIKYLTLYAFSLENWKRPKEEVDALMTLLIETLFKELEELLKNNIRLKVIGQTELLPGKCQQAINSALEKTKHNTRMTLILALSYSARMEILMATKQIAKQVSERALSLSQITEQVFERCLYTANIPHPDLLIRTSGEYRISNFLLWQIAYAELYFTSKYWPDFGKADFIEAIADFQRRERRFGLTSEQIAKR